MHVPSGKCYEDRVLITCFCLRYLFIYYKINKYLHFFLIDFESNNDNDESNEKNIGFVINSHPNWYVY